MRTHTAEPPIFDASLANSVNHPSYPKIHGSIVVSQLMTELSSHHPSKPISNRPRPPSSFTNTDFSGTKYLAGKRKGVTNKAVGEYCI